jgi:hypothetical protein
MSDGILTTPVAFIVFNRPETTRAVFARIRAARPSTLLLIADGPRTERPGEAERCAEAREIVSEIDWPCEVHRNFSATNLGCRDRPASGIDWVFSVVSEAIILEDDCLPDPTFFRYCAELLDRFRDEPRVGMVSGANFQGGRQRGPGSYYFSKYTDIWGWATWRRAWSHYDRAAAHWPDFLSAGGLEQHTEPAERIYWRRAFDAVHSGRLDAWDYQWTLSSWRHRMLCAIPNRNLISNIGFGPGATHTTHVNTVANLPTRGLEFPLTHPPEVAADREADRFRARRSFNERVRSKVRRYLNVALAAARPRVGRG